MSNKILIYDIKARTVWANLLASSAAMVYQLILLANVVSGREFLWILSCRYKKVLSKNKITHFYSNVLFSLQKSTKRLATWYFVSISLASTKASQTRASHSNSARSLLFQQVNLRNSIYGCSLFVPYRYLWHYLWNTCLIKTSFTIFSSISLKYTPLGYNIIVAIIPYGGIRKG